jgi:prepilin-type N-terminal cleavage/methylation domain-containing protein
VSGINKPGFTLIEIMVALAIIALIAAAVVPRFDRGQPLKRRETFVAELNGLVGLGWQQALMTNTIHRVTFDFEKHQVSLQADNEAGSEGKKGFQEVKSVYVASDIKLPEDYEVKQFFIEGSDEVARKRGKSIQLAYNFIVPEGLMQSAVINAIDKNDLDEKGRAVRFGLVIHPFSGQCTYHDSFQKP